MDIVRVAMVQSATKTTIAPTAVKNCSSFMVLMIFYKPMPEIRALFTNLNLGLKYANYGLYRIASFLVSKNRLEK